MAIVSQAKCQEPVWNAISTSSCLFFKFFSKRPQLSSPNGRAAVEGSARGTTSPLVGDTASVCHDWWRIYPPFLADWMDHQRYSSSPLALQSTWLAMPVSPGTRRLLGSAIQRSPFDELPAMPTPVQFTRTVRTGTSRLPHHKAVSTNSRRHAVPLSLL